MILGQRSGASSSCWRHQVLEINLAPLAGSSPGLGRSSGLSLGGGSRLCGPVGSLGLGGPVVGHLESRGSSGRSSRSCSRCRSAVSGPVGHWGGATGSKILTSPLFLGRRSNEVSLLA